MNLKALFSLGMTWSLFLSVPVAPAELLLHYDFEEGGGTSLANRGILGGVAALQGLAGDERFVAGAPGGFTTTTGLRLDGDASANGDWVVSGLTSLDLQMHSNQYTCAAWTFLESVTGDNMVFGQTAQPYLHLGFRNNTTYFGHWGQDTGGPANITTGVWRHVTWVYQGDEQTLYVDGLPVAGPNYRGPLINNGPILIGFGFGDGNFEGVLDDVMVFSEALAPNQVQALATGIDPTSLPPPDFPVQYFTGPYGINGRWSLYEVRGNGVGASRPWYDAHVASTNTFDPLGSSGLRGNLVAIGSADENRAIANISGNGDTWIGLTDNEYFGATESGTSRTSGWVWTSGEIFSFEAFAGGEPNNAGVGEDAAHIRPDMLWNDHLSNIPGSGETANLLSAAYVIEWPLNAPNPVPGATVLLEQPTIRLVPEAGMDNLDITVEALGTVIADLPILGPTAIDIDASDTQNALLGGFQDIKLELDFDPTNHLATASGIEFTDGDIEVLNTLIFTLDLGTFSVFNISLGDVVVTGQNIHAVMDTPSPLSTVISGQTPLPDHELYLNQGVLSGSATEIAADFIAPFSIDLATTPLSGSLGTGNATVSVGPPSIAGTIATYHIQVDIPVNFSELILTDPVNTSVSASKTVRLAGDYVRQLPDWDGDGLIDVIDPDDDNDGLPDIWEREHNLDPYTADDTTTDFDLDGFTLWEEYVADTDPANGLSYQWLEISRTGLELERSLFFPSSSRRAYWVETRGDLLTGIWTNAHTNIIGIDGTFLQVTTNAQDRAYYRIGVKVP